MNNYIVTIASILMLNISCSLFASSESYPDKNKNTENMIDKKQADIICKCDVTTDPCCNPPSGTSSNKTTKNPHTPVTDVSKCKCDPKTDPCCKRVEGTKH